jgi:hypothetical protein
VELVLKLVAAALLVALCPAQVRAALWRPTDRKRAVFKGRVGQHLALVPATAGTPIEGLVRRVSRHDVEVRVVGAEVRVPLEQVREVWEGRRLLARW